VASDIQFVSIRTFGFVLSSRLITSIIHSVLVRCGRASTLHASGSNLYNINLVYHDWFYVPIHHMRLAGWPTVTVTCKPFSTQTNGIN